MTALNSKIVCRILGWLFLALGGTGLTVGDVGSYLHFTPTESYISLGLGLVSVAAARRRRRVSAVAALVTGLVYLAWGTSGMFFQHPVIGSPEPLDALIRELAAIWGLGTASHEAWLWRRQISSAS
ncbi:hypothetical protein [Alicyclobacillus acidiphilus]|uniref:hypothetical protein n=1 Tax=Alicyclobacillus acidiphilus TaxID=182455 RepID=UPI0008360C35|nr:hypothetical protein [Alicyclobacillus acidiphilus]